MNDKTKFCENCFLPLTLYFEIEEGICDDCKEEEEREWDEMFGIENRDSEED